MYVSEQRVCQNFIRKKNKHLEYAILKVSDLKASIIDKYTINIKYGRQEKYAQTTIYLSCGLGLALSVPNIIFYILTKICWEKEYIFFLLMDIILHLGVVNFISKYVYLGQDPFFYLGCFFLALYLFGLLLFWVSISNGKNKDCGIVCLFKKLSAHKTLKQVINENKILPPNLKIISRAFHQESREKCVKKEIISIYGELEIFLEKDITGDLIARKKCPFLGIKERIEGWEYSEWKRVDKGGGKLQRKFGNQEIIVEERQKETGGKN